MNRNVLCGIGVIDTLDLEERCVGVGVALATLVRQVLALHIYCMNVSFSILARRGINLERGRVLTSVTAAGRHVDGIAGERAKARELLRPREGWVVV